jgi:hypothetical protein
MIRKVKKKDYDMYNVDGYYIGDKVLFNNEEFEVVGIDIKNKREGFDILLNGFRSSNSIALFEDDDKVEIVYKKGTKREKYSLWVDSSRISPVQKNKKGR